jgi:transposase
MIEMGKIYGVSDRTVKKWIVKYEKDLNKTI